MGAERPVSRAEASYVRFCMRESIEIHTTPSATPDAASECARDPSWAAYGPNDQGSAGDRKATRIPRDDATDERLYSGVAITEAGVFTGNFRFTVTHDIGSVAPHLL